MSNVIVKKLEDGRLWIEREPLSLWHKRTFMVLPPTEARDLLTQLQALLGEPLAPRNKCLDGACPHRGKVFST